MDRRPIAPYTQCWGEGASCHTCAKGNGSGSCLRAIGLLSPAIVYKPDTTPPGVFFFVAVFGVFFVF